MYKFNKISLNKLKGCVEDLQIIAKEAIKNSPYDFGISSGYRSPDEQYLLYQRGRSIAGKIVTYLDGYTKKSKHNYNPSHAFDIFCYVNNKVIWQENIYVEVALHILEIAEKLLIEGKISNRLFWGGHFKNWKDYPHFQI